MTFLALKQDCYRRLGFSSTPPSDVSTRIGAFINETLRDILSDPDLSKLRILPQPVTFASVASQAYYGITPATIRIKAITERTNQRRLRPMDLSLLRSWDPGLTASGDPYAYIESGVQAVALQPSDASELFVKSTTAGDTTQVAYVEGFTAGGYPRSASVTLTGTTAVSLAAAITNWVTITDFYLSAVPAGVVTLHEDSGSGTELARIGIGQTRTRYQGIQLYPTPSQVITYYVDGQYEIQELVNDTDEPQLPSDFHRILAIGGRMKEYEKTDDARYDKTAFEYERVRRELRYWVIANPDNSANVSMGWNNLNGWFPADFRV